MVSLIRPHGGDALGNKLTTNSMAVYFIFALIAAYINQRTDAQQSMRLDDLSTSSSIAHTRSPRNFPSSGLGTRAAPITMNNFGITFIDATPGSDRQRPKPAGYQGSSGDQMVHTNPFTDSANLLRDDVASHEASQRPDNGGEWQRQS